jgi:hypothetical protein
VDTAASLVEPENCKTAAVIGSSSISLTLGSDGSGRLFIELLDGMKNRIIKTLFAVFTSTGAVIGIATLGLAISTGAVISIFWRALFAPKM